MLLQCEPKTLQFLSSYLNINTVDEVTASLGRAFHKGTKVMRNKITLQQNCLKIFTQLAVQFVSGLRFSKEGNLGLSLLMW